MLTTN